MVVHVVLAPMLKNPPFQLPLNHLLMALRSSKCLPCQWPHLLLLTLALHTLRTHIVLTTILLAPSTAMDLTTTIQPLTLVTIPTLVALLTMPPVQPLLQSLVAPPPLNPTMVPTPTVLTATILQPTGVCLVQLALHLHPRLPLTQLLPTPLRLSPALPPMIVPPLQLPLDMALLTPSTLWSLSKQHSFRHAISVDFVFCTCILCLPFGLFFKFLISSVLRLRSNTLYSHPFVFH